MIDNPLRTLRLLARLIASLPVEARLTSRLQSHLRERIPDHPWPQRCRVTDVHYMGDEGGIICEIDGSGGEDGSAVYASLTHLAFHRRHPLTREIAAYQKHRIKRLRALDAFGLDWEDLSSDRDDKAA